MIFGAVHHVAIIASDLEKSLHFYCDILGFREKMRINRKDRQSTLVYLEAENCLIELFDFPDPPQRLSYPEATGLRHIAFETNAFDDAIELFAKNKIRLEGLRPNPLSGKRTIFAMDPDDLPIEIIEI